MRVVQVVVFMRGCGGGRERQESGWLSLEAKVGRRRLLLLLMGILGGRAEGVVVVGRRRRERRIEGRIEGNIMIG